LLHQPPHIPFGLTAYYSPWAFEHRISKQKHKSENMKWTALLCPPCWGRAPKVQVRERKLVFPAYFISWASDTSHSAALTTWWGLRKHSFSAEPCARHQRSPGVQDLGLQQVMSCPIRFKVLVHRELKPREQLKK
jgi:hypothetical protein